jgi:radical SAM superfamily enzyme YgiQ (UPF0313 family)
MIHTGNRTLIENLDSLPFSDWSLIENQAGYVPPEARCAKVFTVMTSRGCPFDCSFCVSSKLFGRKVRKRSVKNVVAEIEQLVHKNGAKEIHFADDCFTSDRKWVLDFCDSLRRSKLLLNLSFMNGLRADQVDEELLLVLKGAGVRTLGFGVETSDSGLMKESGKNLSPGAVAEAFRISKKLGLNTWGFFVIGFPGETREQALNTFDLALKLGPDFAKFFPLVPYPGSRVFAEMKRAGRLEGPDWAGFGLYSESVPTLSAMSPEEIADLISAFYRKFYLRPGKLLGRLLKIRSASELRLNLRSFLFLAERFAGRRNSLRTGPN